MSSAGHNRYETNAVDWSGVGGPQDVFSARQPGWPLPRIVRGEGIYLWDDGGNRLIDVSSGPVASNLGHNNRRVVDAVRRQVERLSFSYTRVSRTNENIALAERIARFAGNGYERAYFVSGGSEAIEAAIMFARQRAWELGERERTRLFSLMPSYHGGTVSATMLSGDEGPLEMFGTMSPPSEKIPAPLTYRPPDGLTQEENEDRSIAAFEERLAQLGPHTVLAIFLEPVGGLATGCNVLSGRYLRRIREICDRHGILMVFDEVMSGAGRTGRFLTAHYHRHAMPDLVVLAKGIGAGYVPFGVMLAPAAMVDPLSRGSGFNFGHTGNANPLACAVGLAVLEEIEERGLMENASRVGARLADGLRGLKRQLPVIGDVRGMGLLLAVEVVADPVTKRPFPPASNPVAALRRHGLDNGLTIYARRVNAGRNGDWIMTSPPLITTEAEADEIVERLGATFRAFADEAVRDGYEVA